jgi:Mg2+ transporter MgtE
MFADYVLNTPGYQAPEHIRAVAEELAAIESAADIPSHMEETHIKAHAEAFAGMSIADYYGVVEAYKSTPADGFRGMTRGDAFYRPMLEVVDYLLENDFIVYICSGTNRFTVRGLIDGVIDIPARQVIGTDFTIVASGQGAETDMHYAYTEEDKEKVARTISDYGFLALPIVDREMRLVGIVTVDDAMDVLQEENTEDIAKMAAITPTDRPYLKTSVFTLWKTRVLWLLILMLGSTFTSIILNSYEAMLTTCLVACVPMIMGTGGNSGSQASVTVIRALSIGEIELRDVGKVIWKELRTSFFLGLTLAAACFVKLIVLDGMILGVSGYSWDVSLVVSLALFCTVIVAKLVGAILPILAKVCRLDPAVVANPFITTIVDSVSVILFCGLSIAIL